MSAPLIWVVLPALAAMGFWVIRNRPGLLWLLATILALALALAAVLLPIGGITRVGPWSFNLADNLAFAGRRLVLQNDDRPLLVFIYLVCAFWFAGGGAARASRLLASFGYGIVALLVAALAVEPFLYAALLIEMAVLLAVPLLVDAAPGGKVFGQGLLRFVIFQTLAMPFILLAGWALDAYELNPARSQLVTIASICLGLGFSFWLAVFPFYTWVPLLAEQNAPYTVGFLLMILPMADLLLGLNFLNSFNWLTNDPGLMNTIRIVGGVMIVTAGSWSAFQSSLTRLFAYAILVETGFSLLAASLHNQVGTDLFSSMFLPRMFGLGLWALSLSIILPQVASAQFRDVEGVAARLPVASAGLGVAALSIGGLPLLGGFPAHQVLLEEISHQSLLVGLAALVGTVGLLFGVFRSLAVLSRDLEFPVRVHETRTQIALVALGGLALLVIGVLPPLLLPLLFSLAPMP